MGHPHPLPLGRDTATSSPKSSSGGHENQLFGDLELRCLWVYQGWCLLGWVMSCPSQSRALAAPAWGDAQSTLPTGGEPIPAVSFGEDHFAPAHASERSVYQTATNDREPPRAQGGWGHRERAGAKEVTEARAKLPQCGVGVMHSSAGLGSPLPPASHRRLLVFTAPVLQVWT